MKSRTTPARAQSSEEQIQVLRKSEAASESTGKSAEDPSLAGDPFATGQEAGDTRLEVGATAPAVDQGSDKVAEEPSAAIWS